jgi:hypothetical protein
MHETRPEKAEVQLICLGLADYKLLPNKTRKLLQNMNEIISSNEGAAWHLAQGNKTDTIKFTK